MKTHSHINASKNKTEAEYLKELKRRKPEAYRALKSPDPLACLAWNVIELRAKKEWSQAELARRAGVAPRMITYIESFSDDANVSVKLIQKLAQALGVPFRRMFQEVDMTKV